MQIHDVEFTNVFVQVSEYPYLVRRGNVGGQSDDEGEEGGKRDSHIDRECWGV